MGGRLFDWLGAGIAASRPADVDMPALLVSPGSTALYFATDTKVLGIFDESGPAWFDIDASALSLLTTESIQDMLSAFLSPGAGIDIVYNDAGNLLEIISLITQYTDAMAIAAVGPIPTQYTDELAQDALAAAFAAGTHTGLTVTYNDGANKFDFAVTVTQYTNEMAQDAVAAILTDDGGITPVYDDAGNLIKLRNSRFLIPFFFIGAPTADEILAIYAATDAFTLPANLTTTKGTIGNAPAGDYVITVSRRVNNAGAYASIATITIHNDGTYTLATAGSVDIAIAVNDMLRVTGQHVVDAAIANTAFTIRGN
jgi:hypothetical protein